MSSPSLARRPIQRRPNLSSQLGDLSEADIDVDMNNDMDMGDPTTPRAHIPTLSAAEPSNDDGNQDDNGLVRYIWGTNIHIQESMNDFREFLRGFKPKYRAKYNSEQAKITIEEGGVAPPSMPLYDNLSTARGDVVLYEQYLKQLRETGESVLNVDAINLVAYPPTKRLYHQLINYPQEMVPIMDQVLKDVMTEMADEELEVVRNRRAEGQISEMELRMMEEEVRDVEGRVYKTRPFGGEITINMRDLNPGGKLLARFEDAELMDRYRQARLRQGSCNSCHSCHSRHVYG
jgi:DNA replication licensing factor MCM4